MQKDTLFLDSVKKRIEEDKSFVMFILRNNLTKILNKEQPNINEKNSCCFMGMLFWVGFKCIDASLKKHTGIQHSIKYVLNPNDWQVVSVLK